MTGWMLCCFSVLIETLLTQRSSSYLEQLWRRYIHLFVCQYFLPSGMKTHLYICHMPLFAVQFRCFWKHFISWTEICDVKGDLGRSRRGHLYPCLVQWIIKGPGKQGRRNCARNHKPFFHVLYLLYQKLEEKLLYPVPWWGLCLHFDNLLLDRAGIE